MEVLTKLADLGKPNGPVTGDEMPSVFKRVGSEVRRPQGYTKHTGWPGECLSRLRVFFMALVTLAGVFWASACGDGTTEPPPPEPPRATTVTVTPATAQLTALGMTVHLSAQVLDQNGQVMSDAAVTWSSGNTTVATVDGSGLVTAVGNGRAVVTATSGAASGTAEVTVAQVASAVTVTPAVVGLTALGATVQLSAEVADENGNAIEDAAVTWSHADATVAAVDDAGLVTAVGNGTAVVTATSGAASGSAEVTVAQVASAVTVTPAAVGLTALGATVQLSVEVADENGNAIEDAAVTWSHADASVATVDDAGLVTAVGNGTATVTATSGAASGSAEVTVAQVVSAVTVTPAAVGLTALGATVQLSVEVADENGNAIEGAAVTWSNADPSVATVDDAGLVTAVGNGTATVTATSGSASGSAEVSVAQVASAVTVTPATVELTALGATVQLSAEVADENGNAIEGAAVTWSDADPSVATVDDAGLVTAVGNGTATVTATSGSASGSAEATVAQVASAVAVTPAAVGLTALGATVQLSAEVADENGNAIEGAAVTWSNADPSVATVDDAGLVTAVGNGTATVTATSGSASGSATVAVGQVVGAVTVTPAALGLTALGATVQLSAEVADENGNAIEGASVIWSNADPSVATVDEAGLVTAVGNGTAVVKATSGSASGTAEVTVAQVASVVTVAPTADTLSEGDTLRLSAQAEDANGHAMAEAVFSWTSSDPAVAEVDDSGLVTALALGVATITSTAGDSGGFSRITVTYPDRAVLVALYEATDGPNWTRNRNWLSDAPLEHWQGVVVDEAGRVTRLILPFNRLSGAIPPEIDKLANLSQLNLLDNALSGSLPPELGNLADLSVLALGRNNLSDSIPPELGNLADLSYLDLAENNLSGPIPPELGNLADLSYLYLAENNLSGPIPPELGNLADLSYLDLDYNNLSGSLPPELGNLAELSVLALGRNNLSDSIPPELGNLADLSYLDLAENNLSGPVPPELGNLAALSGLELHENNLSGPIPASFRQLNHLVHFYWHDTDLCTPTDRPLRVWLRSIRSHRGTGVNCPSPTIGLRLEFNSLAEVDDWTRTSTTEVAVDDGILSVATNAAGGYGFVWTDRFLESVVTDWEARVRLGRGEASGSAVFRVLMDHPRYTSYAFEFGSERQVAGVETNWRIWFYDQDFYGPGRGSWFTLTDYGYGTSSVIKDGAGEFMDVTIQSRGDSLRIHVDGTLLFGDLLPLRITGALAVDVRGVVLGYQSHTQSDLGHANFDWFELKGQVITGVDAHADVETKQGPIEGALSTSGASIRAVKIRR